MSKKSRVAYFCMEYGLSEELPIYSGGLGVLAGDTLKAAHDAKVPMVGIGIFWSEGYTVQKLGAQGTVSDSNVPTARDALEPTGVRFEVKIRGRRMPVTAHKVTRFGNVPLYLLEPVREADRWVSRRLYGGDADDRVAQEVLLGVGGIKLLRELGLDIDVYHFNEGHAAFAGLEMIREEMAAGRAFEDAWQTVRQRVVFTTHTPVVAGNETHPIARLKKQGAADGFKKKQLEALGGEPFGMTVAGLRLSRQANGVAQLHGQTAKRMWSHVEGASSICAITNGVHRGTFQDKRISAVYERGGKALWQAHQTLKQELLDEIAERTQKRFGADQLLIGFARRAATYKRADLIFWQREKLGPLLESGRVQLVFAGKAHPKDLPGKDVIRRILAMAEEYPKAVTYLENYDLRLGRMLTRGVDVWLNNPQRPLEASGTSGMKAAMNGVLNCSVLDGWWPEMCQHGVNGWSVGAGYEGENQDEHDRSDLMRVLLDEVVPTYYQRPDKWLEMMQRSIEQASVKMCAERMVREYYSRLYHVEKNTSKRAGLQAAAE